MKSFRGMENADILHFSTSLSLLEEFMGSKLAGLIRIARERKGMSQVELANAIGVSQTAIGHWERGVFTPRGRNLRALTDALGLSDTFHEVAEADDDDKTDSEGVSQLAVAAGGGNGFLFEHQFSALLSGIDANVQKHVKISRPPMGQWIVDYMTHRSVIELKRPRSYAGIVDVVTQAFWRLVVLRAILNEPKNYVVVVQRPSSDAATTDSTLFYDQKLASLAFEASLLGLHLIVTDTPEQAIKAIEDLEHELDRS
jgi:transcriptional regulator with XRE-family HTH domain